MVGRSNDLHSCERCPYSRVKTCVFSPFPLQAWALKLARQHRTITKNPVDNPISLSSCCKLSSSATDWLHLRSFVGRSRSNLRVVVGVPCPVFSHRILEGKYSWVQLKTSIKGINPGNHLLLTIKQWMVLEVVLWMVLEVVLWVRFEFSSDIYNMFTLFTVGKALGRLFLP